MIVLEHVGDKKGKKIKKKKSHAACYHRQTGWSSTVTTLLKGQGTKLEISFINACLNK